MKILILSIFMLTSPSIQALVSEADCSPMDIRDSNPRIKNSPEAREFFTTPRNQDSVGWCYAFVASDLISAEIGTPISTTHLSLLFNKNIESSFFLKKMEEKRRKTARKTFATVYEGGDQEDALKVALKNKYICPESLLPFDVDKPKETMEFIRRLEAIKLAQNETSRNLVCNELNSFIPGLTDLDQIAESLLTQNLNLSLEALAQERCRGRMVEIPNFEFKQETPPKNPKAFNQYMNNINQTLNGGRPISISYQSKHFIKTNSEGYHASSVVGRRWNNGKCEYKVRNSFGRGCSQYKEGIDCNPDEGSFWIPDTSFQSRIDDITYITP